MKAKSRKKVVNKSNWIVNSFLLLGFLIVGIGIVSLVAANWYHISNQIKLVIDFIFLFILGGAIYYYRDTDQKIYFDGFKLSGLGIAQRADQAYFGKSRQKVQFEACAGAEIGKFGEIVPQWRGLFFVASIQWR